MSQILDDIRAKVQLQASEIDIMPFVIKGLCDDMAKDINKGVDINVTYKDALYRYTQAKLDLHYLRRKERNYMYSIWYDGDIGSKIVLQKEIVYKLRHLKNQAKYNL